MLHRYVSYGLGLVLGCCLVLLLRAQRTAQPLCPDKVQQRFVLKALGSPVPLDPSKSYFYREGPSKDAGTCLAEKKQTLPASKTALHRELVVDYPWPWGPLRVEEILDPKPYRVLERSLTLAGYLWLLEPTAEQLGHLPQAVVPVPKLPGDVGAPGQACEQGQEPLSPTDQLLRVLPPSRPAVLLRLPSIALPSHELYSQAICQAASLDASALEPVRVLVYKPCQKGL